jgi:hypothetical protein
LGKIDLAFEISIGGNPFLPALPFLAMQCTLQAELSPNSGRNASVNERAEKVKKKKNHPAADAASLIRKRELKTYEESFS